MATDIRIPWKDLLPGQIGTTAFTGYSMTTDYSRSAVVHEYPGRDGGDVDDLGQNSITTDFRIVYGGQKEPYSFSSRQNFIAAISLSGPQFFTHPTIGIVQAVVNQCRETLEAENEIAVYDLSIILHDPPKTSAVSAAAAPAVPVAQIISDANGAAAWLAMFKALMAQLIAAAGRVMSMLSMLAYGPALIAQIAENMFDGVVGFFESVAYDLVASAETWKDAPGQFAATANAAFDDVQSRMEREQGLNEGDLAAIRSGIGTYDAGQYSSGLRKLPGQGTGPSAKKQAAMMIQATYEATTAGVFANSIGGLFADAIEGGATFDPASVELALNTALRRIAGAVRLHEAAFPQTSGETTNALRSAAATLRSLAERVQLTGYGSLKVTLKEDSSLRGLMLSRGIDQNLFETAIRWNAHIPDPNRIAAGTIISLPIGGS